MKTFCAIESERIRLRRDEAMRKAIDNLARYKFFNFGYWSAQWVVLNQLTTDREANPFKPLVDTARRMQKKRTPPNAHY